MADYYTLFSQTIPYANEGARDWLLDQLSIHDDDDDGPVCEYEDRPEENRIWVYAEDACSIDLLVHIVCEYQQAYNLTEPWSLEWANSCSKPRLDAYGGGAVVCKAGDAQWFTTAQFVTGKTGSTERR